MEDWVSSSSTGHGSHSLRVAQRKLGLGSAENHSASPETCPALLDDAVGPPSTHRNSGFRSWSSPGFSLSLSQQPPSLPISDSFSLSVSSRLCSPCVSPSHSLFCIRTRRRKNEKGEMKKEEDEEMREIRNY
jgi:hypothetical protein